MKRPTKNELIGIGVKVNDAIQAVWKERLTIKELEELEAYMAHQETILPLVDPTFIVEHGFKLFDQAKDRIELLKPIIELQQKEKEGR